MAIIFDIGLKLNDTELKSHLKSLQGDISAAFNVGTGSKITQELAAATTQAIALEKALKKATTDKGISYSSLTLELQKSGTSAATLVSTLASGGQQFAASLNTANSALALSNRQVLSLNRTLQEAGRVFKQSFKFTLAQTAIRAISTELKQTVTWVKELNDAVNNIAVVTGKSAEEVEKVTQNAIKGSADLRIAAKDYAEGALIFYQQGLDDEEVTRRNEITIKASKAANQSISEMSQQLTAIWNTYGMVGEEQERAASVGAKMAASTAVDFADIATAMKQAAAPAAQMGVEYNQLAAIIATVGDATQQSASTIGNAYKTIFSRFQQLKAEGTDGEVTLSSVSAQLQNLGIHVIDSAGNLRELGTVINEVGQNWDNWTSTQQTAIAQIVGGTRQYGQFLSLMENFDKYQKNLNLAAAEDGSTLQQQYEQTLDSIESRAENAGEAWKRAFSEVINADQLKTFYSVLEQVGEAVGGILKALGGAPGILTILIGMLSKQLIPIVGQASTAISMLWTNRNPESRQASINKDFASSEQKIKSNTNLSNTERQVALQKNKFSKDTALINEQINTALKTATGQYKTQLEMYKQMLTVAQEKYQAALDEETAAQRGIASHQKALDVLRESLNVAQLLAQAELDAANAEVSKLQAEYNAQSSQVGAATSLRNAAQAQVGKEERVVATSASDESRAQNEQKLVRARQQLAEATEILAQEEQKLAAIQAKLKAAQANANTAKATKDLNAQHIAANQVVQDYDSMAAALTKFDQGEINIEELKSALDKVALSMKNLNGIAAGGETEKMAADYADLGNDINNVTQRGKELEQVLTDLRELKQALAGGFDLDLRTDAADKSLDAHDTVEQARQRQQQARRGGSNPPPSSGDDSDSALSAKAIGESVAALASMAAALTTVINTAKTLRSIWFDDSDATPIEKIGQTIVAVSGLLMGIVPVIGLIGNEAVIAALKINTALGPLGWVIAGITAALVGIIAIVGLISDAVKKASPEYQLQKAKEEAEAFKNALAEAEAEATALQEAFDKYDEVQNALKDCTRGTQEWRDALKAANDQVLEMLRTYPELSQYISKDADGLLTISKEGQDLLTKKLNQKVESTEAAYTLANQNVRDKNLAVSKSNLIKDYSGNLSGTKTYEYNDRGNTRQASITSSQVGTVINKYLEDVLQSTDLTATVQDIFNKEELSGDVEKWVNELQRMVPDLQELDAEIVAATEAKRIENEQIAESIIQNDAALAGMKDNEAMNAGGKVYTQLIDKYLQEEMKNATSRGVFNNGTEASKASFDAYARKMGLLDKDGFKVTNYKGGNGDTNASVTYEYIDEEGKKQTGEATAEMIARFNAAARAGEDLGDAMAKLNAEVERLNASEDQGDKGLGSFLANGNLEQANQGEFNTIKEDVAQFDSAEDYLKNKFDVEDLADIATMAGYDSADEFVTAFEESLNIDWGVIPEGLSKYEALNLASAKRMTEVYKTAMEDGGQEAADAYLKGMDYMLKDVSDKDMEKALDSLSYIDWSAWDAGEQAVDIMKNLEYEIDTTTDEWNNFINAMRDIGDAMPDLEKLTADVSQMSSLTEDIQVGDILSKEDYELLVKYNSELSKYFQILADGSAVLIGDPLDLQQEVKETQQKALEENLKAYQEQAAEAQAKFDVALAAGGGSRDNIKDNLSKSQNRAVQNEDGSSSNAYTVNDVAKQIAFLQAMDYDTSKIEEWKEAITMDENGEYHTTVQVLEEIGGAVQQTSLDWERYAGDAETYAIQAQGAMNSLALTAESADELKEMFDTGKINEAAYSVGQLQRMMSEKWEGMDAKEVENYSKHLQKMAKSSELLSEDLEENAEAAEDVALYTKKMNQGIDKLANGMEDWADILENSDEGSEEFCDALDGIKDAMSDVLGVSEDFLSDDFILDNMEDIKKAAEGDAEAIDRLALAAGKDIAVKVALDNQITDEAMVELTGMLDGLEIPDIQVGATLEDGDFLTKCAQIVEAANMSVEQANAFFRGMGFEPEFETKEVPLTQELKGTRTYTTGIQVGTHWFEQDGKMVPYNYIASALTKTEEVPMGTKTEYVEVPALTTDGSKPNFKLTKTNAGAMNNYSSSNKGGTTNPGGGNKSGGGGSGSKTPPKKKGDHKEAEKIKDRYTNIQSSIDKTTRLLERLADAEDDSWGYAKFKNLRLINEQLGIQGKKLQILYKEAKAYLAEDQEALQEILRTAGIEDAIFNSDGFVANHENITRALNAMLEPLDAAVEAAEKAYDAAVDRGLTDDDLEPYQKAIDDANDAMDKFNEKTKDKVIEALEQVDETAQKVHDTMSELIKNIREVMQNWVDKQKIKLDLKMEINNQDIRDAEHLVDLWGDIGTLMGENVKNYREIFDSNNKNTEALLENATTMQTMIEGLMHRDNDAGNWLKERFGDKAYEEWLNGNGGVPDVVMEQWASSVEELQDVRDTMQETLRSMMQEWTKYLELILEDFDKLSQRLERNQETLDMWGKVLDGMGMAETVEGAQAMAKLTKASYDTAKKTAHVYKEQALTAKAANENAEKALKDFKNAHGMIGDDVSNLTENELIQYQEYLEWVKQSEEALNDAESSFKSAVQDMVDKMGEVMEAETTRLRAEFFDKINGAFTDWDTMTEIYDGLEEIDDLTLDDLTKNYELDKLGTSISDYLENATNPEALEYGSKLLDEINAKMASGEKITQEQLEGYQKQFEVMQAMDAFEEAKNNKNTMRLARDASGNYSYVYSSDQSQDTEDKAQRLKDAIYEYEKLQQDAADKYEDLWIQTYATIGQLEELKNTARYKNDEKYAKYVDEKLRQEYEKLDFYAEHIDLHYQQLNDFHEMALNEDSILFQNHVDHELETFKNSNLNMVMGTQDTYDKITDFHQHFVDYMSGPGGFAEQLEQTGDEIVTNTLGDIEEVGEGLDFMEGDYTHLAELVEEKSDEIIKDNEEIGQSATDLRKKATSAFNAMTSNIVSNSNQMVSALNKVTAAIKEQIAALQKLRQEQLNNIEKDEEEHPDFTEYPEDTDTVPSPNTTPEPAPQEPSQKPLNSYPVADQKGIAYAVWNGTAGWGNGADRKAKLNEKFGPDGYATYQAVVNQHDIIKKAKNGTWTKDIGIYSYDELRSRYGYNAFDTGGYTGNDEGLAILHEKELVLNAEDTKNILAAVAMMRQTVAGQLGSLNGALSASVKNVSSLVSAPEPTTQSVDQQVRIEASFPGVSVAKEVEDALNDLINQAAQYNIKK